jgi:predicted unusual protein kinase regulating ubiquinone biosynthesis (AarF/ABC1/UbiB family)
MLEEFDSTLRDELDYHAEGYNMQRLATNMEPIKGVHIATLERSLSSQRVLTQSSSPG